MKAQDVTVYREIQRNTQMAMRAIDAISDKVYNDELAHQISRQSMKYSEIRKQAYEELMKAKTEPYHEKKMSNLMLVSGIHMNTMLNTSTGHIAELMIKGSNMGVLEMNKVLNHNKEAGEKSVGLAKSLIEFENDNVERLNHYL